jgi:thioredoxin 1
MGFIRRLLGLEQKPGEPKPLTDHSFEAEVLQKEIPCFVEFFSLWCSPCQVMSGLLNEIGPMYLGRAEFFKIDVTKNPSAAMRYTISSVPTLVVFKKGTAVERQVGLIPLRPLRRWIESHLVNDGPAAG